MKSSGERVLCIAKPDGKATASFAIGCLLPLALVGPVAWLMTKAGSDDRMVAGLATMIGTPVGAIAILRAFVLLKSFTLTVTTARCTLERGFVSKTTIDVSNKSIRSVQVARSLPDRILGTGTVSITTTGDEPEIVIPQVANPTHVADCIKRNQIA